MSLLILLLLKQEERSFFEEACLSFPGQMGKVLRPEYAKVEALNRNGEKIVIEGKGVLAVALCHETDHLDGILYVDKVIEGSE